jgi:hypothetical protein
MNTTTAALVARQSRTNDESLSVQDQIDAMRAYCERVGWHVGNIYEEPDVSGRRPLEKRKGLKRAVDDVEAGRAQVILTAYFDRFVRSYATRAEVLQRVEKLGGQVFCLDTGRTSDATAADWLSGSMMALMAEYQARQGGEKLTVTKQRNIDLGKPPFPHVTLAFERIPDGPDKGRLRPSEWAPLIAEAVRMRAGVDRVAPAPWIEIQRYLDERGLRLTQNRIRLTLDSRLLIGEIHFGENFTPNLHAHEPIVEPALWRRAQEAKAPKGRLGHSERLLARLGVLVCGTCGSRLVVCSSRTSYGVYRYYRCMKDWCERPAAVMCDTAEQIVRDETIRLCAGIKERASARQELEQARLARVEAEERYAGAIRTLAGRGGEAATREVLDELEAERDVVVAEHERLVALTTPDLTISTGADWELLTFDERRRLIRAVIVQAVVAPGKGPGRVTVEGRELLAK